MTHPMPSCRLLSRSQLMAAAILSGSWLLAVSSSQAAAVDPDYEDWWLCANDCEPDDAACVDKCTDDYNAQHRITPSVAPFKLKRSAARGQVPSGLSLVNKCPQGTRLTPFDMPIYDRKGVFVVGYQSVWMCLPDDLEPAG